MSIYTKPINEITSEDLDAFFRSGKQCESINLEFKSDWPRKNGKYNYLAIAESIAALANTYGGILFIGVSEKKEGNENTGEADWEKSGIDYDPGFESKVYNNVIKEYIYPYLLVEVTTCSFDSENKMVGLIRIQASEIAPHFTKHRDCDRGSSLYVRHMDSKDPEPADYNVIDRLIQRRESAIRYREFLIKRSKERAFVFGIKRKELSESAQKAGYISRKRIRPVIFIACVPKYPSGGILDRPELDFEMDGHIVKLMTTAFMHHDSKIYYIDLSKANLATQIGSKIRYGQQSQHLYVLETSEDGLVSITANPDYHHKPEGQSAVDELIIIIDFLTSCAALPILLSSMLVDRPINYIFNIELIGFSSHKIMETGSGPRPLPSEIENCAEFQLEFKTLFDRDYLISIMKEISEMLAWAINSEWACHTIADQLIEFTNRAFEINPNKEQ